MPGLRIDITTSWSALPVTRSEWNDLLARCADANVFQSFEWYTSWWKTFGQSYRLLLMTAREGDRLLGIAPFMIVGPQTQHAKITFISGEQADYQDFLIADDANERVLDLFLARLLETDLSWRILELRNIPAASANLRRLTVLATANGLFILSRRIRCPTLCIRGHERQVQRMLNKYSLRRPHNALRRLGEVRWRIFPHKDEALEYLPVFAAQHAERWRYTTNHSRLLEPEYLRFYQEVIHNMLPCGMLNFSVLELDGEPIAFHFGFLYRGRLLWYKPSFSITHAKQSPGSLLIRYLIDYALNSGINELDFTIGDEPFKQRFTNSERINMDVSLFQQRMPYQIEKLHRTLRSAARRCMSPLALKRNARP